MGDFFLRVQKIFCTRRKLFFIVMQNIFLLEQILFLSFFMIFYAPKFTISHPERHEVQSYKMNNVHFRIQDNGQVYLG